MSICDLSLLLIFSNQELETAKAEWDNVHTIAKQALDIREQQLVVREQEYAARLSEIERGQQLIQAVSKVQRMLFLSQLFAQASNTVFVTVVVISCRNRM